MRLIDADSINFSAYKSAIQAVANTPTFVDVVIVPEKQVKLRKAIKRLIDQYMWAITQEWIQQPLTYALYYTWKEFDRRK